MKTVYLLLLKLLVVSLWEGGKANDVVAREGDNVTFSFNITSEDRVFRRANSNEGIIRLKDDFPSLYNNSYKERVQYENKTIQEGLFNLTLLNVSSSDAGSYVCEDAYNKTTCSLLVILKEPDRPEVKCDPEPVEDEQVKLTCSSTSNSLPKSHSLEMRYEWMENGQIHPSDAADILLNVSRNDRVNNYTCRAYDETNTPRLYSERSEPFVLHPLYGPDSIKIYPEQVLEGTNVTCRADCNPNCNITWGGQAGQLTSGLGQVTFRMNRGQPESSCTAWNEHGNTSRSVNVSLVFSPEIRQLTLGDANETLPFGDPLNFTGIVSSNPEPTVTIRLPNGTSVRVISERTDDSNYMISYTIDKATCDDHGIFHVTATNDYGSNSSSVAVTVLGCVNNGESNQEGVQSSGPIIYISVAIVIIVVMLIVLISGGYLYRRRKRAGRRRYSPHGTRNIARNSRFRQEYATVPKKSERPIKDVYTKVDKSKGKPFACRNHMFDRTGHSSDQEALIIGTNSERSLNNNCGEKNEDGLLYADLDLLPPTLKNGRPVIIGTREETVYQDIDFTKTPGPQLPDKIWEIEKM